MQTIYALHKNGSEDIVKNEKFLLYSIDAILDLYLVMISILIELRKKEIEFLDISSKKHLATAEDKKPNTKFINNFLLTYLCENKLLNDAITSKAENIWIINEFYISMLLKEIKAHDLYKNYMASPTNTFKEAQEFIISVFSEIIVVNEKLYDFLEDCRLTWTDDIPTVNTLIRKQLSSMNPEKSNDFKLPKVYSDNEGVLFAKDLFRKTILNEKVFFENYKDKTPNWDSERIAEIDTVILKMAICEFLKFPSIPTKVTINEYLEIAKEYSGPKSSIFINGILNNIVNELEASKKIIKTGLGLINNNN